jgi:hypothetical protein
MPSDYSDARQNHVPFPSLTKIALKNKFLLYDDITSLNASINCGRGGNELNGFADGIFSSMSTYQMEFDVEIVSLMGSKNVIYFIVFEILCFCF